MSGTITEVSEIRLSGTKNGKISIATIERPYGPKSENVVSIGISLQGNVTEPDWKVHIPETNIDAVITALQEAKKNL